MKKVVDHSKFKRKRVVDISKFKKKKVIGNSKFKRKEGNDPFQIQKQKG